MIPAEKAEILREIKDEVRVILYNAMPAVRAARVTHKLMEAIDKILLEHTQ